MKNSYAGIIGKPFLFWRVKKKYLTRLVLCCTLNKRRVKDYYLTEKGNIVMGNEIEKIVKQSLLYDFYGELLTEHQRNIYEAAVFEDLSLAEIALDAGISRQGVHDLLKRCNRILEEYESKLHLVEKFRMTHKKVEQIHQLAKACDGDSNKEQIQKIIVIAEDILEEL